MSNKIIDGKLISSEIRKKVKKFGDQLKSKTGKVPGLAVVLVGENPASRVYVKNKIEKTIEVPKYVPKYITKDETVTVEVPADVDSLKVVEDYYAKYIVKDTLNLTYDFGPEITIDSLGTKPNPSLGLGFLTDTISQNRIISRKIEWNFQIPTIYNTKIVKELPKRELYYGLGAGFNKTDFIGSAKFGLLYKDKKDKVFGLDLGVINANNNVTPYVGGSLYWKLSLKKK